MAFDLREAVLASSPRVRRDLKDLAVAVELLGHFGDGADGNSGSKYFYGHESVAMSNNKRQKQRNLLRACRRTIEKKDRRHVLSVRESSVFTSFHHQHHLSH
jgi:hypothetical protein